MHFLHKVNISCYNFVALKHCPCNILSRNIESAGTNNKGHLSYLRTNQSRLYKLTLDLLFCKKNIVTKNYIQ